MTSGGDQAPTLTCTVGRYAVYDELAAGGMATVHLGRLRGAAGFSRIVAIKRLHAQYATDHEFVTMFTDEARIASRIRHPNVVATLDVLAGPDELFQVMEYVHGETLARLLSVARKSGQRVSPQIAASILIGTLRGLHEAHEACDEQGTPLGVVHRDVSPHNIIVGADGVARVLDFGVAKASNQMHRTGANVVKGKLGYMAPEQLLGEEIDRRADVFAAGVVLWEVLTGERLFSGARENLIERIRAESIDLPSSIDPEIGPELDAIVQRSTYRERGRRYASAADMARALENALDPASNARVGAWVRDLARDALDERRGLVARIEAIGEERNVPATSASTLVAAPPIDAPRVKLITPAPRRAAPLPEPAQTTVTEVRPPEVLLLQRRKRTNRGLLIAALCGVAVVAGIAVALATRPAPPQPASALPHREPSAPTPPASAPLPEPPPAAPSAPPPAGAAPSATPPSATPPSATPPSATPPSAASSNKQTPRPAANACNPPYTIEGGIKRYKRECLR